MIKRMRERSFMPLLLGGLATAALLSTTVLAQATPTAEERLAKAEAALASAQTSGDNAWMLICSALVLMMTGPGRHSDRPR